MEDYSRSLVQRERRYDHRRSCILYGEPLKVAGCWCAAHNDSHAVFTCKNEKGDLEVDAKLNWKLVEVLQDMCDMREARNGASDASSSV